VLHWHSTPFGRGGFSSNETLGVVRLAPGVLYYPLVERDFLRSQRLQTSEGLMLP